LRRATEGPNHKWWAFGAVSIGIFMSTLDVSIVNISLPRIMAGVNTGFDAVQWVILAYLLTITSLLLVFGRLADLVGRKNIYVAGFAVFTVGNLGAALSHSVAELGLARALAGVGGAMLQANSIAITAAVFPDQERGKALGLSGTIVAAGLVAGPTIGGLLTDALGWRSIFFIAIPVGLVGIPYAMLVLRESRISQPRKGRMEPFDWLGAVLWAAFLFAFLYALNRGPTDGWSSAIIVSLFAVSAPLLIAFVAVELRNAYPTIRLSLFRVWGFSAGCTASFCAFTSQQAILFLIPFYLQLALGLSVRTAGVLLTAVPLAMAVAAPISGRLSDHYGSRGLSTAGLVIVASGLFLLARVTTAGQSYAPLVGTFLVLGVGLGMFQSPNNAFIFGSVPREHYGAASGFVATVRNAGSSLGIGVWGTIVTSELTAHGLKGDLDAAVSDPTLVGKVTPVFLNGLHIAMYAAVVVVAVGIVMSALRGPRMFQTTASAPPLTRSGAVGDTGDSSEDG
jgi:EmrB/QacA subfamily drug resistance transporter